MPIDIKNINFVEDLPMIIPGQFGFNCSSGFREEAFGNIFPIKNVSKRFYSETTWTIETKLPRNDHWKVSEKRSFEHFPIGSNVNLCIAVVAILDFRST
jgi:hypothetical protein